MDNDNAPESNTTEGKKTGRRPYVAPAVSDFFQPVVALGSLVPEHCAAPKRPKY